MCVCVCIQKVLFHMKVPSAAAAGTHGSYTASPSFWLFGILAHNESLKQRLPLKENNIGEVLLISQLYLL